MLSEFNSVVVLIVVVDGFNVVLYLLIEFTVLNSKILKKFKINSSYAENPMKRILVGNIFK